MNKKFWVVLLALLSALCLSFGLAACGGNGGSGGSGGGTEQGGGAQGAVPANKAAALRGMSIPIPWITCVPGAGTSGNTRKASYTN